MNIIYLLFHGLSPYSGISKKILCQIKALRELGHRVNVCTYDMNKNRHRVRMMDEEIIEDYGTGKWAAVRKRISYDGIYRYAVAQEVNMIYVRFVSQCQSVYGPPVLPVAESRNKDCNGNPHLSIRFRV